MSVVQARSKRTTVLTQGFSAPRSHIPLKPAIIPGFGPPDQAFSLLNLPGETPMTRLKAFAKALSDS